VKSFVRSGLGYKEKLPIKWFKYFYITNFQKIDLYSRTTV
jgi:hypothetical protein